MQPLLSSGNERLAHGFQSWKRAQLFRVGLARNHPRAAARRGSVSARLSVHKVAGASADPSVRRQALRRVSGIVKGVCKPGERAHARLQSGREIGSFNALFFHENAVIIDFGHRLAFDLH
jgi:hypothetical protein